MSGVFQCVDISLDMPNEIDISHLRGRGMQPGEVALPEDEPSRPTGNSPCQAIARSRAVAWLCTNSSLPGCLPSTVMS